MTLLDLPTGVLYFLFSFLFAVFLITVLTPLTYRWGLTDNPDKRKTHKGSVPLIGGIVMFVVMAVPSLVLLPLSPTVLYLLLACLILTAVGVYDDRFNMSYKLRLAAQIGAALVLIFGVGDVLVSFGTLVPGLEVPLGWFAVPVTVVGVVAIINAYNLIDGMDGLAGGLALVAFVGLYVLLAGEVSGTSEMILVFLVGALVAYMLFNLHVFPDYTTKVFMGDAGSTLLGFVIVAFLVRYTQAPGEVFEPVTALWLVAVPLMDMVVTFVRRIRHGKSPFHPDRTHVHHIFLRARFTKQATLMIILGWAALLAVLGIGMDKLGAPAWLSFLLFLGAFAMHAAVINNAWKISKWVHR